MHIFESELIVCQQRSEMIKKTTVATNRKYKTQVNNNQSALPKYIDQGFIQSP